MNALLTKLGVPETVQHFFDIGELIFTYGEHFEHFEGGFHRVPTTGNLWLAGKESTREVIITTSAMEAISYATLNSHRYHSLESLSFIAIGNLPHSKQLRWIRDNYPKRKFTLVFSHDILGHLTDIIVAAGLRKKNIRFLKTGAQVEILWGTQRIFLPLETLSLSVFEKNAGIRTGIRTCKPKAFHTFLEQLKNHETQ